MRMKHAFPTTGSNYRQHHGANNTSSSVIMLLCCLIMIGGGAVVVVVVAQEQQVDNNNNCYTTPMNGPLDDNGFLDMTDIFSFCEFGTKDFECCNVATYADDTVSTIACSRWNASVSHTICKGSWYVLFKNKKKYKKMKYRNWRIGGASLRSYY